MPTRELPYPAPYPAPYPPPDEPGLAWVITGRWEVVEQLDINHDDVFELLVFRDSEIALAPEFSDPAYIYYPVLASEFAVVQIGGAVHSTPTWLLNVTTEHIAASGETLISFVAPDTGSQKPGTELARKVLDARVPAAFLIGYSPESDVQITIIPVDDEGRRFMQSLGVAWDSEAEQYRLILSVKMPPADPADTSFDK